MPNTVPYVGESMDKKQILQGSFLFGGLPARQLEDIAAIRPEKVF